VTGRRDEERKRRFNAEEAEAGENWERAVGKREKRRSD
jgi:hypothetical protein